MKKEIEEEKYGKEYFEALQKVLDIRQSRKKTYDNSFLDDSVDFLLTIIDGKRRRFDFIRKAKKDYDKTEDEIIDIVNYYIFVL